MSMARASSRSVQPRSFIMVRKRSIWIWMVAIVMPSACECELERPDLRTSLTQHASGGGESDGRFVS